MADNGNLYVSSIYFLSQWFILFLTAAGWSAQPSLISLGVGSLFTSADDVPFKQ